MGLSAHCLQPLFLQVRARPDPLKRTDTLEIAFDSKPIRTLCESEVHAKHVLGSKVAEILKHRLADLRAATSVRDLVAGRPRVFSDGAHKRCMAIDLCDGYRIVFCANHNRNPTTDADDLDWPRVNRIRILGIESSHGK